MQRLLIVLLLVSLGGGGCMCKSSAPPATFSAVSIGSTDSNRVVSGVPIGHSRLLAVSHATSGEQEGCILVDGWSVCYPLVAGGTVRAKGGTFEEPLPVYIHDWAVLHLDGVYSNVVTSIGETPI
jgi:hypothetical protein